VTKVLEDIPREWLIAATALLLLYVFVHAIRRFLRRQKMFGRFERGAEGEREAAALLVANGLIIEGAQVVGGYELIVDGEPIRVSVRADFLVRTSEGDRFVAEVKTGRIATRIETAATRRQILEYGHAFGVSAVLLVDADEGTIRVVELPATPPLREVSILRAS